MKLSLAVLSIGITALVIQGAVNTFVPARFTPDLNFLIVIAIGLHWRSAAGGLVMAAALGFAADLLSGSLLGELTLLRLLGFGAARLASRRLNLRGALPQAIFVFFFTGVNALGVGLLNTFFTSGGGFGLETLRDLPSHASINALAAPLISAGFEVLADALRDDESGRRGVRLGSRSWHT